MHTQKSIAVYTFFSSTYIEAKGSTESNRDVDPSRLDIRVGKVISAAKVCIKFSRRSYRLLATPWFLYDL